MVRIRQLFPTDPLGSLFVRSYNLAHEKVKDFFSPLIRRYRDLRRYLQSHSQDRRRDRGYYELHE